MELLPFLTRNSETIEHVKKNLKEYTIYPIRDISELEELLCKVSADIFLVDTTSFKAHEIDKLAQSYGKESLILVIDSGFNEKVPDGFPFYFKADNLSEGFPNLVQSSIEKKRKSLECINCEDDDVFLSIIDSQQASEIRNCSDGVFLHRNVLANFAKTLTANFDINKLLFHFMDSIVEITKVNKISIMLRENNIFVIKAQKGMDPYLANNIRLDNKSVLVKYLSRYGRIVYKSMSPTKNIHVKISQEMNPLQCVLSIPMMYKGRLEGIVNVGTKITGAQFYKDEIEVLYILCNYLSASVKDYDLYYEIQNQKDFIKNMISDMNSGIITINRNEQISICNFRASEILNINQEYVVGKDLRYIPSPLGDILYETMVHGTFYKRHEIVVGGADKLQIGVNSFSLKDKKGCVVGAGIIFTDLSDLKKLEQEKVKTEKLKMINIITGKIAHEIKNPLSAILSFTQLLNEKYDDENFREFYETTVMQSIRKLNNLIDKIITFTNPINLMPKRQNVDEIIGKIVNIIKNEAQQDVNISIKRLENTVLINIDKRLLTKGLYYLLTACAEKLDGKGSIELETKVTENEPHHIEITINCLDSAIIENGKDKDLKSVLDIDTLGFELDIAIVKKILEEHGGDFEIKPMKDSCTFILTFPLIEK